MYVEPTDVNAWLESSKLTTTDVEGQLDTFLSASVLGKLATRFDTSAWVDRASSPSLVVQLIAMLYAATIYRRSYSEDLEDGNGLNWAEWLESSVKGYLEGLLDGTLQLADLDDESLGTNLPAFYPTDASSVSDPAKFAMTQEF